MTDERDTPPDEPTAAEVIASSGDAPEPGHPAAADQSSPSAGEQIGRGGDDHAVPGDDVLLQGGREDAPD